MQVSWAPDIEIHAPITLTAPSNNWVSIYVRSIKTAKDKFN